MLIRVFTNQNCTLLEITCHGSYYDYALLSVDLYVLLSPCLCFIYFLYLNLYVLGDDAWIS